MSLPEAPDAEWIDHREALDAWINALPADAVIGLDTEFMRRNTFYPQLALLQLFDTQIAAAFVGMGLGISYRALVAELAGAELDKGETRSDWLQRPLTASQCSYAALDVVYLQTIHEQLTERLRQRDRTTWFAEDCERLRRRASHRVGDPQPQRALRGAAEWPLDQQAMLRRLLLWRDRSARRLDVPRPWLMDDALALSLAQHPPVDAADLDQRSRGQRALRAPQRVELLALIASAVDLDEISTTARIPGHPQGDSKKALNDMKHHVDTLAGKLDLPPGLLCPRKALEEYVVTAEWPELLEGWRREVLHDRLVGLLPG
jgi:ribonuclease D